MYYSSFGILCLILHFIVNFRVLSSRRKDPSNRLNFLYRQFLNALVVFYLTDLLWGLLAESNIRILAYGDTMLFFGSMAASVLLWTRYVVAFLNQKGITSKIFIAAGWTVFGFVITHLIVNFFNPIIFTFTDEMEYTPGSARYMLLGIQFLLFVFIAVYCLFVAIRSQGSDRSRYTAICVSGAIMAVFITLQSLDPFAPFYTIGCFITNCMLHVFVEEDEKREQDRITEDVQQEKERYSQIASSLAEDYEAIYYIEIETGKYMEITAGESDQKMKKPLNGEDFYAETRVNVKKFVHPDDREFALSMYKKETMLENLEGRRSYSYKYRVMLNGTARYFRFVVMLSDDGKHFVLCDKDIQDTMTKETALREKQKANVTFTQIAESLASNYDVIYYVDLASGEYVGYTSQSKYGELKVDESGDDFFEDARKRVPLIIHPQDRERMLEVLDKDYLISALEGRKQFDYQYRLMDNDKAQHTRSSVRKTSDGRHMIIGVENIDDEVRREKEHIKALNTEKELARRDELTGIRNKTAYKELEQSVQNNIEQGMDYLPFAIAVCDLNNLKKINDTEGHKAGDEYIRASAKQLCRIFAHSPVFRIGGDEFVVFLSGDDFSSRNELIDKLHELSLSNRDRHEGPVIAVGMTEYDPSADSNVIEVFNRADRLMYENKRELKENA